MTPGLLETARERLAAALADAGYLDAEVQLDTASRPGGVAVSCSVRPGKPARLGGWLVQGNDSIPTADLLAVLPGPGARYRRAALEQAVQAALALAAGRGYPLCRAEVPRVELRDGRVFPELRVDEGELVRVERLTFVPPGGASTRLLSRSAGFRPGQVYSPARLRSWRRNLERGGLVTVTGSELARSPGGFELRYGVRARRANRVTGAVGYAADAGQLTGLVELNLRNLLNTGRRLGAHWRAYGGLSEYALSYTEPWLLGQWLSLTGSALLRVVDTSMSRAGLDLAAELEPSPDASVRFAVGYEQLAALDTTLSVRTTWAGTGAVLDFRDDAVNPVRGSALRVDTRVGQRLRVGRSRLVSRVEADAEQAGPNWWRLTLDNRVHYRLVHTPDTLADEELIKVGGARTLRGYREDEFGALQAAWWNVEVRFDLRGGAAAYPFFDLGVLRTRAAWLVRPGYGAGARLGTGIGTFGIDYGLGWQDRPLDGKVHFGFEGEF